MIKKTTIFTLLFACLILTYHENLKSFSVPSGTSAYSIARNHALPAATPITSDPTISQAGWYALTGTIDVSDGSTAITISSSNVYIDLNSVSIVASNGGTAILIEENLENIFIGNGSIDGAGSGSFGINASAGGYTNLQIFDVNITNFDVGIVIGGPSTAPSENTLLDYVQVSACGNDPQQAAQLYNCDHTFIYNSNFSSNSVNGLTIAGMYNSTIQNCKFSMNTGNGLSIGSLNGALTGPSTTIDIIDCQASQNTSPFPNPFIRGYGFSLGDLNNNAINFSGCSAQGNSLAGFNLSNTVNCTLRDCNSTLNEIGYSLISTSTTNILIDCVALSNTACGFDDVTGSTNNYLYSISKANNPNYCVNSLDAGEGNPPYFYSPTSVYLSTMGNISQ